MQNDVEETSKFTWATEETRILYQISRGLNAAQNEQELLQVLAEPAIASGALSASLLYIESDYDIEPEWIELVANWRQDDGNLPAKVGARFYIPDFPFSNFWLQNSDQVQLISDVNNNEEIDDTTRQAYLRSGARAAVVIPLYHQRHWVGLLSFNWAEPYDFSLQEMTIYQALTGLATPAVDIRRLLVVTERAVTETLYKMSRALNVAQNADQILQAVLEPVIEAGGKAATLLYNDNEAEVPTVEVVATWRTDDAIALANGDRFELEMYPFFHDLLNPPYEIRPVLISNMATDPRMDQNTRQISAQMGIQANVVIPLVQAEKWVGLLVFGWTSPHSFSEREIAIFRALPSLVTPPVENRRLVDNLEQMVMERTAKLQESQQILQSVLDNIPARIFWKDKHLNYLGCNQAFANDAGLDSPNQIVGKNDFDLPWAEQADYYRESDLQVMVSGIPSLNYEEPLTIAGESEIWKLSSKVPLFDETGNAWGIIGIFDDITERKQVEDQLHLNQMRLNSLLEISQRASELSEQEIVQMALEEAAKLTNSEIGYLHFINPDQTTIQLVTWTEKTKENCEVVYDSHYPLDQAGVWADCVRLGSPVIHNDYQNIPDKKGYPQGHAHLIRHASVPVFDGEKISIILGVGNKPVDYDDADVNQMVLIGDQLMRILQRKKAEDALRESEEKLRSLIENSPDGIVLTDEEGIIVEWSSGAVQLTGLTQAEVLERALWDVQFELAPTERHTPEIRGRLQTMILDLLKTGNAEWLPHPSEMEIVSSDGTHRFLQTVVFLIQTERGYRAGSMLRDITERKQTEAAILAAEERSRLILQSAQEGILGVDTAGKITFINQAAARLSGYAANDLMGDDFHTIMYGAAPDEPSYSWKNSPLYKTLSQGENVQIDDIVIWNKDGTPHNIEFASAPILKDKDIVGAVVSFKDITELVNLNREFVALLENTPAFIYIKDNQHKFTAASQSFAELVNHKNWRDLIGKDDFDIFPPEHAEVYYEFEQAIIAEGKELTNHEEPYYAQDGELRWVSSTKRPIRDHTGRIVGLFGISTDITDLKRLTEELTEASIAAEAANRAKSAFLANMSHELRTPLNGILGYAQILQQDQTLNNKQRDSVGIIERSGEHLLTLLNDILDLSKVEAGKMELSLVEFHLPTFLENIADMFQVRAQQNGLTFAYKPLSELPGGVRGDERHLRQVLMNLLGNALKFTEKGGVTFNVGYHFNKLRFQVKDTGVGIKTEDMEAIFAPFQQVGIPQMMTDGTGLGLPITRRLVEMMGGELHVDSTYGQGSTFWFDLDLPMLEAWQEPADVSKARVIGYKGARRQVLIVDDKPENRSLFADMLGPLGFELIEAVNGQEGVEKTRALTPDLILMDLIMPILDGYAATRQIRKLPKIKDTVIIIAVSASAFGEDRQRSLENGCDGFVAKPFRLETLLQEIQAHLGLTWIYDGDEESIPEAGDTDLVLPPPEVLQTLLTLAQKGQVVELGGTLDELESQNAAYKPFVANLRELAKNFKLREIRKQLNSYLSDLVETRKNSAGPL